jgi:hypothetical protein
MSKGGALVRTEHSALLQEMEGELSFMPQNESAPRLSLHRA